MVPFSIKKKQLFKTTIAFLWLCLFFCSFANAEIQKGKTGIESLDTLPVYEWDIKTENCSLPLTLLWSILPGGGHFYSEHYVRGGFILAAEVALTYEVFINKPYQQDRRFKQARPYRDSVGK